MVIEDFEEDSEAEGSGGEDDIRELRAKKLALALSILYLLRTGLLMVK